MSLPTTTSFPAAALAIAPDDRLAGLEPGGVTAGDLGRHHEAVEGDDLGQDRVRLDRLAEPGVDPDDRPRERRPDLEERKLGPGGGELAPGRGQLELGLLKVLLRGSFRRQELFLPFVRLFGGFQALAALATATSARRVSSRKRSAPLSTARPSAQAISVRIPPTGADMKAPAAAFPSPGGSGSTVP